MRNNKINLGIYFLGFLCFSALDARLINIVNHSTADRADNSTDDGAIIEAAIKDLEDEPGSHVLRIPSGVFNLKTRVEVTINDHNNWSLTIEGYGRDVSNLLVENTQGGFSFNIDADNVKIEMNNLSIFPKMSGDTSSGTGIYIDARDSAMGSVDRSVYFYDMDVRSDYKHLSSNYQNNYFTKGIWIRTSKNLLFDSVCVNTIFGRSDANYGRNRTDHNLHLETADNPEIRNSYFWGADEGVTISVADNSDCTFDRTLVVNQNKPVMIYGHQNTSGNLNMIGGHYNGAGADNINVRRMSGGELKYNLLYSFEPDSGGTKNHYRFWNCSNIKLKGEIFWDKDPVNGTMRDVYAQGCSNITINGTASKIANDINSWTGLYKVNSGTCSYGNDNWNAVMNPGVF